MRVLLSVALVVAVVRGLPSAKSLSSFSSASDGTDFNFLPGSGYFKEFTSAQFTPLSRLACLQEIQSALELNHKVNKEDIVTGAGCGDVKNACRACSQCVDFLPGAQADPNKKNCLCLTGNDITFTLGTFDDCVISPFGANFNEMANLGDGDDCAIFVSTGVDGQVNGGNGNDKLFVLANGLQNNPTLVVVGDAGDDCIYIGDDQIESARAGDGDDVLFVDKFLAAAPQHFYGDGGDNYILFKAHNDVAYVYGGADNDVVHLEGVLGLFQDVGGDNNVVLGSDALVGAVILTLGDDYVKVDTDAAVNYIFDDGGLNEFQLDGKVGKINAADGINDVHVSSDAIVGYADIYSASVSISGVVGELHVSGYYNYLDVDSNGIIGKYADIIGYGNYISVSENAKILGDGLVVAGYYANIDVSGDVELIDANGVAEKVDFILRSDGVVHQFVDLGNGDDTARISGEIGYLTAYAGDDQVFIASSAKVNSINLGDGLDYLSVDGQVGRIQAGADNDYVYLGSSANIEFQIFLQEGDDTIVQAPSASVHGALYAGDGDDRCDVDGENAVLDCELINYVVSSS